MINKALIIPTGDELALGIVVDSDSPAIISSLIEFNPNIYVTRFAPIKDNEEDIEKLIQSMEHKLYDLIILIGGSGGGHRHIADLGKDYTHSVLEKILEEKTCREIYGSNGHMWCKIVVGFINRSIKLYWSKSEFFSRFIIRI